MNKLIIHYYFRSDKFLIGIRDYQDDGTNTIIAMDYSYQVGFRFFTRKLKK